MNFLLNTNHDMVIENGNFKMTSDSNQELTQKIECSLRTFLGEWWIDPSIGVPYFEYILVKSPDLGLIRDIFTVQILSVQGVKKITLLEITFNNTARQLLVNFEVIKDDLTTSTGTITI